MPEIGGDVLRAWRHAHGWSQDELARRLVQAAKGSGQDSGPLDNIRRYVYRWEDPDDPRVPGEQRQLWYMLALGLNSLAELAAGPRAVPAQPAGGQDSLIAMIAAESQALGEWIAMSEVADASISQYQTQVRRLARDFEYASPLPLILETRQLRERVQARLRQHVRLEQARDLYLVAAQVCGLLAWMTGDLGSYRAADTHAWTAWMCAEQAGHDGTRAWVRLTQAKLAYWDNRYAESAQLAEDGLTYSSGDTARAFLALFRARALARMGRSQDAHRALALAQTEQMQAHAADQLGGVWGLTPGRFHGLVASTLLPLGEPSRVLAEAAEAIALSESAPPAERHLYSETLARIDAAYAHLSQRDLDGVAAALRPVLDLPPQSRIDPVVQQVAQFRHQLAVPETAASPVSAGLQDEIETWRQEAVPRLTAAP